MAEYLAASAIFDYLVSRRPGAVGIARRLRLTVGLNHLAGYYSEDALCQQHPD